MKQIHQLPLKHTQGIAKFPADSTLGARGPSLTKPLPRPPVRLLAGREANLGVQPEAVVEVCGAALGLADDVEVGQAAQAVVPALVVVQVVPEHLPEVIEYDPKALGIQCIGVGRVRVCGRVPSVLCIPARVLAVRKEFGRND